MPEVNDRVKETSTTTGTGALTLGGAVSGFDAFSAGFPNDTEIYYTIDGGATGEWEVGVGTFNTTLSRDRVLNSSNSDALVNFSSGTKYVFSSHPAEHVNIGSAMNGFNAYRMYQDGNPLGAM